jgi:uroporphyrinogen decarboxylase
MTGRQRILTALDHREGDRVPFDLGSTHVTGIAARACKNLRDHLGLPERPTRLCDLLQQLAAPEEDLLDHLGVDTRGLYPLCGHNLPLPVGSEAYEAAHARTDRGLEYVDEWGFRQLMPPDGLYYTIIESPLPGMDATVEQVEALPLPDGGEPWRIEGLAEQAKGFREAGHAVVCKSPCAGLVEMGQRVRGMENFLVDLLANPAVAEAVLDRFFQIKLNFWSAVLGELGGLIDVVFEMDDYGTQHSQLVSPEVFRQLVKPRLATLIGHIHKLAPRAKVAFHSCGSVRPILPDFIEVGIDVLNPVHVTAEGMEPTALKRDFGDDLCFWGGGVETQSVLPRGTPAEVREDVRRNVEALAPGGGWVFATVHDIQADVPAENIVAMWETLRECGQY